MPSISKETIGCLQAIAAAALVVGAVVGVVKYTGKDKDVEHQSKGVKGKLEKKGQSHFSSFAVPLAMSI